MLQHNKAMFLPIKNILLSQLIPSIFIKYNLDKLTKRVYNYIYILVKHFLQIIKLCNSFFNICVVYNRFCVVNNFAYYNSFVL